MANESRTLYTGVTNDLARRVLDHKKKAIPGFTARYGLTPLVYYEEAEGPRLAIEREKQIKGWVRAKKIALIQSVSPLWRDLSHGWYSQETLASRPDPSLRSG